MYWNLHPAAAAVLATIRSQDGRSKKTYFLEPSRPPAPNTSKVVLDIDGLKSLSPVEEVGSSSILPSSQSVDSELKHDQFEQKSRQKKPLFMDINVILDDGSPSVLSTETPSTTTVLNDPHATTMRSTDKQHSILDPFRTDLNHQAARKTSNYGMKKDSKSIWLLDEEQYEDNEESDDYEVADLSQPSHLPVIDVSVTSNDELNGKEYSSNFEEEYENDPDDDTILVIGHLSTLSPVISASERQDGTEAPTPQFHEKENKPSAQIGLSEWPVQIGLQARSKSSLSTKPVEYPTYNLNKQQTTPHTQESNNQQLKNSQTKFNENNHRNALANLSFEESNDNGNSNHVSFRSHIGSQFMESAVAKTFQPQTSKKLAETEMTNHYGNPNGGKPIKSVTTTSEPEKSNYYISSQEERKQETSTTMEPDEAFYYLNSEEETDHDISLDYPDEEEIIKPMAAETNTPGTVFRQSPSSFGRPPYFVSSSVAPLQHRMDSDNDFELMKPIELVANPMDIDPNNGITVFDGAIQPMLLLPFPADHVLINQPDLVVKPQPPMSTTLRPVGKTETPKKDSFLVNYNHSLPSVQSQNIGSNISSNGTAKHPYISVKLESEEKDLSDLVDEKPRIGYSVQEEPKLSDDIKPNKMKISNIKIHEDPILPVIHQDEFPSPKTTSSSTRIQPGTLSQPTRPMAASKNHADQIIVTPNPRPFVQTTYTTRSSNKAGSGPYFVSTVEPSSRRNSYSEEIDMTKPLIEYNRSSAAKRDEGITDRSTTSASAGRPPYFVTSPSPTSLHPMNMNDPTAKPTRNMKIEDENSDRSLLSLSSHALLQPTSSGTPTFTKEESTTTPIPVERIVGRQFDNFDISFGPVRPTLPYILTRLNAVQPIQPFYPSSTASNVTERILDIDLPAEEGMKLTVESLPSPIGISNKNNVFVVPKQTRNYTAGTPVHSSSVPSVLSTSKPGFSNRKNQLETTTGTIVYHNMGSFVVTSSPIRSSIQPRYTSRPATVATIPTIKEPDLVKSIKSEENNHKVEINYPAQKKTEEPIAVVPNPIGISNKDNVFVVPKTVKGIIQLPIRSSTLPTDTLVKRQNPSMNSERQSSTLRPFERVVSHQMGSFVVTSRPKSVQQVPNTAARETIFPTEIPGVVVRSSAEPAGLAQPPYFATNPTYELIGTNKRKMGKSEPIARSRIGSGSRNSNISRIGPMAQSTLIDRLPAGQLTSRSNMNRRKQQQSRPPL